MVKTALKYVLGIAFALAGANHFVMTDFYVSIMPPYLPWHLFLVYLSGVIEFACGVGLLVPRISRVAAWGMFATSLAVFPANIHMALHTGLYPQFSVTAMWLRLPLQLVLLVWIYWYARGDKKAPRPEGLVERL
jgi:uncharacterized membrane protein